MPTDRSGIAVGEIAPGDRPIVMARQTRPAFIGRALRGPLDTPVLIDGLSAYNRVFGGAWHRSSMSRAVEQFFEHGGRQLYVVRVANGATGAELALPGPAGPLTLAAVEPGSMERLRAAVDYDGIGDADRFNLSVQRLASQSGLVIDQEIFPGVSLRPDSTACIVDALADSAIVELRQPLPAARPQATMGQSAFTQTPYVAATVRGSDGSELCDYDLVGSAERHTGLFSLDAVDDIDLLYLPPPVPGRVPGPTALLAAELYCRRRGAMLIADPPADWGDAVDAAAGVRHAGLASANALTYFPRLADGAGSKPVGGAIAGLLCKLDADDGPWGSLDARRYAFGHKERQAVDTSAMDRQLLLRSGVNVIAANCDRRLVLYGDVTLARGEQTDPQFARLSVRRLCLKLAKSIEQATRWAVFETDRVQTAARVEQQLDEFVASLEHAEAIDAGASSVRCETRHDAQGLDTERGLTMLLTVRPAGLPTTVSLTLYHTLAGCRIASTAFGPVATERSSDAA